MYIVVRRHEEFQNLNVGKRVGQINLKFYIFLDASSIKVTQF